MQVDLNADVGEGGPADAALLELVSSANIACGVHAGGPMHMDTCVRDCQAHHVAIGAHPSFAGTAGEAAQFGRAERRWEVDEVRAGMLYQLGALQAIARARRATLTHVKPHGALYNQAAREAGLARTIVAVIRGFDASLSVYALAGSRLASEARTAGLICIEEVFADRAYRADGTLVPRSVDGAVLHDGTLIAARVLVMLREHRVQAIDGTWVMLNPQTICLHGDHPDALDHARAIRAVLTTHGMTIAAPAPGRR